MAISPALICAAGEKVRIALLLVATEPVPRFPTLASAISTAPERGQVPHRRCEVSIVARRSWLCSRLGQRLTGRDQRACRTGYARIESYAVRVVIPGVGVSGKIIAAIARTEHIAVKLKSTRRRARIANKPAAA